MACGARARPRRGDPAFWRVTSPPVTNVRAGLSGHPFDLDRLCRLFASGDPVVSKDGEDYYFVSEGLVPLIDDGSALHTEASKILTILNGVGRADSIDFRLVGLTGTFEAEGPSGSRVHQVLAAETVEVRTQAVAAAVVIRGDGTVARKDLTPPPPPIVELAGTGPQVDEVLGLLARPELDWVVLFKIFEVIRDEVGGGNQGLVNAGLMTPQDQSAFTGSANHPAASGPDARHARQSGGAPKVTMTLAEGREFIRGVVNGWARQLQAPNS